MSRALMVELSDEAFAALQQRARSSGAPPERVAAADLERQYGKPARPSDRPKVPGAFRRHFGTGHSGAPIASDNEALDAALAREYADNHEDG